MPRAELRLTEDHGERRPELVADIGEEASPLGVGSRQQRVGAAQLLRPFRYRLVQPLAIAGHVRSDAADSCEQKPELVMAARARCRSARGQCLGGRRRRGKPPEQRPQDREVEPAEHQRRRQSDGDRKAMKPTPQPVHRRHRLVAAPDFDLHLRRRQRRHLRRVVDGGIPRRRPMRRRRGLFLQPVEQRPDPRRGYLLPRPLLGVGRAVGVRDILGDQPLHAP